MVERNYHSADHRALTRLWDAHSRSQGSGDENVILFSIVRKVSQMDSFADGERDIGFQTLVKVSQHCEADAKRGLQTGGGQLYLQCMEDMPRVFLEASEYDDVYPALYRISVSIGSVIASLNMIPLAPSPEKNQEDEARLLRLENADARITETMTASLQVMSPNRRQDLSKIFPFVLSGMLALPAQTGVNRPNAGV